MRACPQQLNLTLARLCRNTNVGFFPNRCEGGTSLVLMEYMACGRPVTPQSRAGGRNRAIAAAGRNRKAA
jgi:hypothetical protein